jgi:hypothetical protein
LAWYRANKILPSEDGSGAVLILTQDGANGSIDAANIDRLLPMFCFETLIGLVTRLVAFTRTSALLEKAVRPRRAVHDESRRILARLNEDPHLLQFWSMFGNPFADLIIVPTVANQPLPIVDRV